MADKNRPSYKLHYMARWRAKVKMRRYYPGVASRYIEKKDPILWAILYSREVHDLKKEYGYVRGPRVNANTEQPRGEGGRFIPKSRAQKAGGVPG